jgi:hypothetical protein
MIKVAIAGVIGVVAAIDPAAPVVPRLRAA